MARMKVDTLRRAAWVAWKTALQHRRDPWTLALTLGTAPALVGLYAFFFGTAPPTPSASPCPNLLPSFHTHVPNLIVFSALMLVFSSSMRMARELEAGTLERLRMTPLRPWEWMLGVSLVELCLGVLTTALTLGAAAALGFEPRGAWAWVLAINALGGLACIGAGMGVASLTRGTQQAFVTSSVVMFLWMLFSGVVFPVPSVEWVSLGAYKLGPLDLLPTTHAGRALRKVLYEGSGLAQLWPDLLWLLGLSGALFLAGALRLGRLHRT